MGKRLEDLNLRDGDAPIGGPADGRDIDWYRFLEEIDALTNEARAYFALDTLLGIRDSVEKTRRVTEGQRRAVANIAEAARRPRREGFRRRYEGYGGR